MRRDCNMTCNEFFSNVVRHVTTKLHHVTAAYSAQLSCKDKRYTLQSTCNLSHNTIATKRKIASHNISLLCTVVASPKRLRDKSKRGHATRCNLPATCLATLLRDKLQEKLYCVTHALRTTSKCQAGEGSCLKWHIIENFSLNVLKGFFMQVLAVLQKRCSVLTMAR